MSWSEQTMQKLFEKLCECGKVLKWSVHWRKGLPVDFALGIQVPNILLYITTSEQRLSILCTTSTTEQNFYFIPLLQCSSPAEQPFTVGAFVRSSVARSFAQSTENSISTQATINCDFVEIELCYRRWTWSESFAVSAGISTFPFPKGRLPSDISWY